MLDKALWWKFK